MLDIHYHRHSSSASKISNTDDPSVFLKTGTRWLLCIISTLIDIIPSLFETRSHDYSDQLNTKEKHLEYNKISKYNAILTRREKHVWYTEEMGVDGHKHQLGFSYCLSVCCSCMIYTL